MFDLPVATKKERRIYTKFRDALLDDGFLMMQYSIYSRYCKNIQDGEKHIERIKHISPTEGNIRIIKVTERQYEEMVMVVGIRKVDENIISSDYLTII